MILNILIWMWIEYIMNYLNVYSHFILIKFYIYKASLHGIAPHTQLNVSSLQLGVSIANINKILKHQNTTTNQTTSTICIYIFEPVPPSMWCVEYNFIIFFPATIPIPSSVYTLLFICDFRCVSKTSGSFFSHLLMCFFCSLPFGSVLNEPHPTPKKPN